MRLSGIIELAREAHAGQRDKQGRDYVEGHLAPIAAAAAVFSDRFGDDAEAAGWLHDIIEDTPCTAQRLRELGVAPRVVAAVESVTRREDESYEQLITRACDDPLGCIVKLADNGWNIASNPGLAAVGAERARQMLADRYEPARARLLRAAGLELDSPVYAHMLRVLGAHLPR